jgi:hypothetical protein
MILFLFFLKKKFVIKKNVVNLQSQIEREGVGPVVQLVRMPPCHGGGRGFESRPDRKILVRNYQDFLVKNRFDSLRAAYNKEFIV